MPPEGPRPEHEDYVTRRGVSRGRARRGRRGAAATRRRAGVPALDAHRVPQRDPRPARARRPAERARLRAAAAGRQRGSGFDNIADLLFVSPVVMERYIAAAQKIARLAVGDLRAPVMVNIHQLSEQLPQDERVDGLPFGTRGGLAIATLSAARRRVRRRGRDGERASREPHEIELSVDGVRVAVATIGAAPPAARGAAASTSTFRVPLAAGPHLRRRHVRRALRSARREHHARPHARPRHAARDRDGDDSRAVRRDRARRRRRAATASSSAGRAAPPTKRRAPSEILRTLARRAYRRPADRRRRRRPHAVLRDGPRRRQLRHGHSVRARAPAREPAVPVSHRARAAAKPGARSPSATSSSRRGCRSSSGAASPTTSCSTAAERGALREPGVLRAQVQRMLADPRSESMVTNFAAQWLFLRDVAVEGPRHLSVPRSRRLAARGARARDGAVRRQRVARRRQRARAPDREAHVRQRAARQALRHPARARQLLPPRGARRRQPAQRPARPGQHPDGDVVRDAHVARAARQVRARQPARFAAAAAAARRAVARDRGRRATARR